MSERLPDDGTLRRVFAAIDDGETPGHEVSDTTIARWVGGVDRSLVGHSRDDRRAMPLWALRRILTRVRLPTAVAALREIAPRGVAVGVAAESSPTASLLAAAAALNQAAATLTTSTVAATADGRVDDRERREGEAAADAVEEALREFRAALRGAR